MHRTAVAAWLLTVAGALAQGRLISAYTLYGDTPRAVIAVSDDGGESWREVHAAEGQAATVRDMAVGDGVVIAVTERAVLRSTDGLGWATVAALAVPPELVEGQPKLAYHGVGFGDGRFLLVGELGLVHVSADRGETWTRIPKLGSDGQPVALQNLHDAAYGGGQWILSGPCQQLTALRRDGERWSYGETHRGSETSWSLNAKVAWGGGRWLALTTEDSQVWQSGDGQAWQDNRLRLAAGPPYPAVVCDAAYGEVGGAARWAICFLPGRLATSADLSTWEIGGFVDRGGNQQGYLGLTWAGERFVAAGHDDLDGPALLTAVCRDGTSWEVRRRAVPVPAASGPDRLVA